MRAVEAGSVGGLLMAAAVASAHLEPGSLSSPKAGQSYPAGAQVKITWVQAEYHYGKYALAYSRNGGAVWEAIAVWTGPTGDGVTVNYTWTLPDAPGPNTRVRVCQIENCDEQEYVLISGDFTLSPAAPVRRSAPAAPPSLRHFAHEGRLQVSFGLDRAEAVSLEAYDAKGILVATWLDGVHAAGVHAYSLASPRLRNAESLAFRLRLGGRSFTL